MLQAVVAPPQAPAPPAVPEAQASAALAPASALPGAVGASPREAYRSARESREVLGEYMSRLLNRRENVSGDLRGTRLSAPERAALEQHYGELNKSIIEMEKQIHAADRAVALAAAVPGSTVQPPRIPPSGPPEEMLVIGTIFVGTSLVILAFAIARRILKGAGKVVTQIPSSLEHRFTRLEQSIDTVAIEVERISEGQRFLTRVLGEQSPRAVGAGAMQPVQARGGEAVPDGYRSL